MQLVRIHAKGYRCLADFELEIRPLNVLIGANAAGKSTVLDALAFLREAVAAGRFRPPVLERGGFEQLLWKGQHDAEIVLNLRFAQDGLELDWDVRLSMGPSGELWVRERLNEQEHDAAGRPVGDVKRLLDSDRGTGAWYRAGGGHSMGLKYDAQVCGLAAASVNEEFRGREVAEFVRSWSFFDPFSEVLRRSSYHLDAARLNSSGANLAARLRFLQDQDPNRYNLILEATRDILGFPRSLSFEAGPTKDMVTFAEVDEFGHRIPQVGASSGTLRLLALATALLGNREPSLIGIEEPENHLHPLAIDGFVQLVQKASETHQILITTHWPGFLDGLADPSSVCVVRRGEQGTKVERPRNPELIREALRQSGFGLGEYFETTGFGA